MWRTGGAREASTRGRPPGVAACCPLAARKLPAETQQINYRHPRAPPPVGNDLFVTDSEHTRRTGKNARFLMLNATPGRRERPARTDARHPPSRPARRRIALYGNVRVCPGRGHDIVESHDIATRASISHKPMSGNGGPAGRGAPGRRARPAPRLRPCLRRVTICHHRASPIGHRRAALSLLQLVRAPAQCVLCGVLSVMR